MHDHIKTIILAGGLGTRLKGTLGYLPKPMAPIGDEPFLVYLIRSFSKGSGLFCLRITSPRRLS